MTDRRNPDPDESVSDDQDSSEAEEAAADIYQSEHLPATRWTRMRPNALDLERGTD
jgi:hypothetical protein